MNKLVKYLQESLEELKKVTWPTKSQTLNYSVAVIGISVLLAAYIGALDFGLAKGVQYVLDKKAPAAPAGQVTPETTSQPIQVNPGDIQVQGGNVKVTPTPVPAPATK